MSNKATRVRPRDFPSAPRRFGLEHKRRENDLNELAMRIAQDGA